MAFYIGIDLGTSAMKLLLMDCEGNIKNVVSKESYSKGQFYVECGVARYGLHRFPLFQADFSGFSRISCIAAISSFSVGILIIPTAVKEISMGMCFAPFSSISLL